MHFLVSANGYEIDFGGMITMHTHLKERELIWRSLVTTPP